MSIENTVHECPHLRRKLVFFTDCYVPQAVVCGIQGVQLLDLEILIVSNISMGSM